MGDQETFLFKIVFFFVAVARLLSLNFSDFLTKIPEKTFKLQKSIHECFIVSM